MANWRIFKISRKTFFNPSAWLDLQGLGEASRSIWSTLKSVTTPASPSKQEDYAEALVRLKITNAEAQRRGTTYWYFAMLLASVGLITALFSFYLLFYHTVQGWILGMAATALFCAQAFRFHFWYFQIKHRKLGCTYAEWRQGRVHHKSKVE